jgi:hypothetical protein
MSYIQDMCSNTCRSSCKVSIIYVWNVLTDFTNTPISNVMKIGMSIFN